jgi:succinate dehydrogenase / fumarate reductase cytochrome b subunit
MATEKFFKSSIGKKVIMGLTGLFLISFLVVHVSINSLIFITLVDPTDAGATFNAAAKFMSHNPLIRVLEIGLFIGFIAHIVQGLVLVAENRKKRPVAYAVVDGKANSTWYSRSMGLLGTLILIFLILHLKHFWLPTKEALYVTKEEHDTFKSMLEVFSNPITVVFYVAGVISLAYHLLHGFSSAFQTFGLKHKKYTPVIKAIGVAFSIIVPFLFAMMPILVYAGLIK